MTTEKQREAARENVKAAQAKWQSMSSSERARSQPDGESRAEPGTTGEGDYYRIIVRDSDDFETFRTHDVGDPGGLQRVSGRRSSGSWDTQAWLISKDDAHVTSGELIADSESAKDLLSELGSKPVHKEGDVFTAKDRQNVPESEKPTPAQQRARKENIKKAQAARHKDDK